MVIEQNGHDPLSMNGGGALALRVALSVNPLQAELWYRLAQFDATTGNPRTAVAILREGLRHCSDQPDLLYLLANSLHHIGELMEAIDTYRRCVTLAPHIVEAWIELPLALLKAGRFEEAELSARDATTIAPRVSEAHINLGTVLSRRHRYLEAMQHFDHAMALAPTDARAWNQAGLANLQLGDNGKAVALFERALALRADYAIAHSNLALAALYAPLAGSINYSIKTYSYEYF